MRTAPRPYSIARPQFLAQQGCVDAGFDLHIEQVTPCGSLLLPQAPPTAGRMKRSPAGA
jgi:hypothetical protein